MSRSAPLINRPRRQSARPARAARFPRRPRGGLRAWRWYGGMRQYDQAGYLE